MQKLRKKSLVLSAAAGLLCAAALTAVLCLPFSALIARGMLPMDTLAWWALLAAGVSVLVPTAFIARLRGRQAMPTAGWIAGGYILLAALLCVADGAGASFGPWLLRVSAAVLTGALAGAVMSIGRKRRRKRR